ncbi:probable serine/threonine-protein kinase tsuA isoform X1 [Drosophila serrata]|uniref:probable serine/threonine-protein kinase tsuA isoform X1 n=1 Tax=Drosophila serrata TaxID=7274 RepID=UPI000A1D18E1|nr:probable serine/threonine-protein kinase tsuA isoform X1 [Drosophila serrata]
MAARKQSVQYSRADLLSLRYEGKSRQRPQCSNRVELQTLNFWKVNLNAVAASSSSSLASCSNYANRSKDRLSPETDNSSLNSSNNGSISSRRAMRNRERANNYYQRFVPGVGVDPLPICGEEKEKSFKSPPIIDHRSISSSHLMPAFAKRRFAAVNGGNGNGSEVTQNPCDDVNGSELTDRVASPQLTKPSTTTATGSPKNLKISCSNLENSEGSETERRLHYVQLFPQVSQCSSPTLSSSRLERQRIGSGRLLVNSLEYNKNQKAKECSQDIENETSFNGNNRHRTYSGRITENIDRRFQYDNKRHTDNRQNIVSNRRGNNKEVPNSRGKRLNTYHHEEPEWFSAGPTSQLETIDLHGFDELENNESDNKVDEEGVRNNINILSDNFKDKNLAVMQEVDGSSSSEDKNDTKEEQNKNQSNSETQFNFDAFLNMHPLDTTLMTNDEIDKNEIKGTSRFSRWFRGKDSTNNTEPLPSYHVPLHVQEKHGIPSVKDLEAQMTKVEKRPSDFQRADNQRAAPVPAPFSQITPVETQISKDTEAFKKVLQQLGGSQIQPQDRQQVSKLATNAVSFNLINNLSPELPVESIRKSDHRAPQQLHLLNMNTTNSAVHDLEQNRVEMQQLMQNINRGDISVELLEKELHNPNTPPHSKEMIVSVIREFTHHNKRNPAAVVHSDPHLVVNHHSVFPQHEDIIFPDLIHLNPANHHGINQHLNSGHTHGNNNSQTPLAFTPTSVLRKMTADKDTTCSPLQNSSHNQHLNHQYQLNPQQHVTQQEPPTMTVQQQQPRMILGGASNFALGLNPQQMSPNFQQQCRSNQNQILKWNSGVANMHMMHGKSFGRPILKGGPNSLPQIQIPAVVSLNKKIELQQALQQQQQHHQQMQQQQQLRFKTSVESNLTGESLHQNINFPDGYPQHNFQQQPNLLMQHQQQQRQSLRPRVIYGELHQQHNHQPNFPSGFHELCGDSGNVLKSNSFHRDERIPSPSPSNNNQLAQWFSPELLAKASAGKLPHLNQSQALSLEEFERSIQHSSAVVHN